MKKYSKPTIFVNDEDSEGVYAASGCYSITVNIHQKPQNGRGDYRIQVNGIHKSNHTRDAQTMTISFNMPVVYKSSNGVIQGANTGTTLVISYAYHQNPTDNIGLGDLIVEGDQGLQVTSVALTD